MLAIAPTSFRGVASALGPRKKKLIINSPDSCAKKLKN